MLAYKAMYDDHMGCPVLRRIRKICHYGSLDIRDVTERSVLFMKS